MITRTHLVTQRHEADTFEGLLNAAITAIEADGGVVRSIYYQTSIDSTEALYSALIVYTPRIEIPKEG